MAHAVLHDKALALARRAAFVFTMLASGAGLAGPPYIATSEITFPGVDFQYTDLAMDAQGNAYAAGVIVGHNFPGVSSAQVLNAGAGFRFVARFGPFDRSPAFVAIVGAPLPNGALLFTDDFPSVGLMGLALDGAGNAYTVAYEAALERDYPQRGGAYVPTAASDRYVYRISPTGAISRLGAPLDPAIRRVAALAVDGAGALYLTGSANDGLRTTAGAAYAATTVAKGCIAPYALKFDAAGAPVYATYLGFAGMGGHLCAPPPGLPGLDPTGYAIAVDAQGSAVIAGQAQAGVMATPGAIDSGSKVPGPYAGNPLITDPASHAFVTRLDPSGTRVVFSARLGGSLRDRATAVALDAAGAVIVAGKTTSPDFPQRGTLPFWTSYSIDCLLGKPEFGFLAKLAADGSALAFSGFLPLDGGELDDCGSKWATPGFAPAKLVLDAQANIVLAGPTTQYNRDLQESDGAMMPAPSDSSFGGGQALVVVSADGRLLYSSALPQQNLRGLGIDRWGNLLVEGARGLTRIAEGRRPIDLQLTPSSPCTNTPVLLRALAPGSNDSGSIEFRVDGAVVATKPVSNTAAAYTLALAVGVRKVAATYHGPGPYDGYGSSELALAVNQAGVCP
jgi:hypothetical protein